jgi:hypothetical protein
MRSRRHSLASALAALAGLLFLQAAIAFAPCELPGRSAATAIAAAMAGMPDCHEADQANLCLAHCASEDQAVIKVQLDLPDLAAPEALPPMAVVGKHVPPAIDAPPYLAAAGPPPRILFQSFLL